jgi:DNA polymerase V
MSKPIFALVDCNNFYVSCERTFQPALETVPVMILSNNDGCVISRSAEVKALGIKMGEPVFKLKDVISRNKVKVFSSNYTLYGDMSQRVMDTLHELVEEVEIYSVDEAFMRLDGVRDQEQLARKIKHTIKKWTGIPVSIGIAPTKVLAKVANHIAKKNPEYNGVFDLTDRPIDFYLHNFPVSDLWGVGRQYKKMLEDNGIRTALQLKNTNDNWVQKKMTIKGLRMLYELRGISCLSLEEVVQPKKGITCSKSFGQPVTELSGLQEAVASYITRGAEKLREEGLVASYLRVFILTNKFNNDAKYGASKGIDLLTPTAYTPNLIANAERMLAEIYRDGYRYKKAGIMLLGLLPEKLHQQNLFERIDTERQQRLMNTLDIVNTKHGRNTLTYLATGIKHTWSMRRELLSPNYTTQWSELPVVKA